MTVVAPADEEARVTAHTIARLLSCSIEKVYRMARDGEIPSERVGRAWRFKQSAVLEALNTAQPALRFQQSNVSAKRRRRLR
ncbi:helix-turn-helix domain-containing protein [Microbacterium sp. H37-C3]|uniref:helix-turn-helix domain-containing protein n=1 Tax=Microbacterium sp. H37-C3 TaxID=3004354 RepID=UPI0022AFC5E0|nr:helix-turn-helix domain-containing protein [Microbacterium sp. H37-C3]MCZ4066493.1 helix-turn-helix domain-containing protein [Microbacterium sp. H37-C3]